MVFKFFGIFIVVLAVTISSAEETDSKVNESKLQSGATDESKPNEIYLSPGQKCDIKCSNLGDKCVGSTEVNPPAGWFCVPGYARKASGKCVKQERCKSKLLNKYLNLIKLFIIFSSQNHSALKMRFS